jgi:hypothetical protein
MPSPHADAPERPLRHSLYYFASDEGGASADDKRRLLFDTAFAPCGRPSGTSMPSAGSRPTLR